MTEHPLETITLANLAEGAADELFVSEIRKIIANIVDPNTDATQRRTLTLTISITPDDNRELCAVSVKASSKLAGLNAAKTNIFIGRHKGEFVATEYNPKQAGLFDPKPELRDVSAPAPAAQEG